MSAKTGLLLYDRRGSRAMSLSFLLRETPESPKKMKAGVWEDLRRRCRLYMVLSGRAEPSGCSAKLQALSLETKHAPGSSLLYPGGSGDTHGSCALACTSADEE